MSADDPDDALAELSMNVRPGADRRTDDRLALASDASTAPSVLAALASAPEAQIRRAVAANPNASPETLVTLAGQFPDEFFANPALSLYLLENPALLADMPEELLSKLMPHPSMPLGLLIEATRHRAFYVRRAAAQNPRMPPELLVELAEKQSYFEEVAGNPSTPPQFLAKVARHDWPAVRLAAARNPSLPEAAFATLANDGDAKVRKAVVRNPTITDDAIARLASHESALVRLAVAESERTPASILARLEGDPDGAVRFAATRTRGRRKS